MLTTHQLAHQLLASEDLPVYMKVPSKYGLTYKQVDTFIDHRQCRSTEQPELHMVAALSATNYDF